MARDYKDEYAKFQSSTEEKKNRAKRNKNRRKALRDGRVKKGDGKDIDHVDRNPLNKSKTNLRIMSVKSNRSRNG